MIEREFINQKTKEFYIKKFIEDKFKGVGISEIKLKKIPLGEKIIIYTNRPSIIVGSKGSNIKELTRTLKKDFKMDNPQVEINEVKSIFLDANIVADRIVNFLERFGSARFKSISHKIMENVLNAGALGVEIIISGKIPGARAKSWRFYQGYLKKCGDVAISEVRKSQKSALLKSGIIGIKVAIMPPGLQLPDDIEILPEMEQVFEEIKEPAEKESAEKKVTKKKATKKKKKEKQEKKQEQKANPAEEKVTEDKNVEESLGDVEGTIPAVSEGKSAKTEIENMENEEELGVTKKNIFS